jgi:hypothetical protein
MKATKPMLEEALADKVRFDKACRQLQVERAQRHAAARGNSKPAEESTGTKQPTEDSTKSQERPESVA